jgi:pSer/pThr/pTyr-binding forkhead associated (FHA) protein
MMDETRQHHGDGQHGLQGPHQVSHFVPLLIKVLPEGRVVELTRPAVVVGRHSGADLRLAYPDVSRRHCRLVFDEGLWRVHDLDSLNGVYVNGERMNEAALYAGDEIRLGEATLLVTAAPGPEAEVLRSIADVLPPPGSTGGS